MPKLHSKQLDLNRCPYCNVDRPSLNIQTHFPTNAFNGRNPRMWAFYICARCGGVVTACSLGAVLGSDISEIYPKGIDLSNEIPERARDYLDQAINSLSAPAGAVMLAASAVDAMLKAKNLKEGSLYSRIDKAAADHIITADMAAWAHEVRLDANDQRHADDSAPLPGRPDAQRVIDFALALAQFMFILPASVRKGREEAQKK